VPAGGTASKPCVGYQQRTANVFPLKKRSCWPSRSCVGICVLTKGSAQRARAQTDCEGRASGAPVTAGPHQWPGERSFHHRNLPLTRSGPSVHCRPGDDVVDPAWRARAGSCDDPATGKPQGVSDVFGEGGEGRATPLRLCHHARGESTEPRAAPATSAHRLVLTTSVSLNRADAPPCRTLLVPLAGVFFPSALLVGALPRTPLLYPRTYGATPAGRELWPRRR